MMICVIKKKIFFGIEAKILVVIMDAILFFKGCLCHLFVVVLYKLGHLDFFVYAASEQTRWWQRGRTDLQPPQGPGLISVAPGAVLHVVPVDHLMESCRVPQLSVPPKAELLGSICFKWHMDALTRVHGMQLEKQQPPASFSHAHKQLV